MLSHLLSKYAPWECITNDEPRGLELPEGGQRHPEDRGEHGAARVRPRLQRPRVRRGAVLQQLLELLRDAARGGAVQRDAEGDGAGVQLWRGAVPRDVPDE